MPTIAEIQEAILSLPSEVIRSVTAVVQRVGLGEVGQGD